jgi:Niemann-Pick C1 protein
LVVTFLVNNNVNDADNAKAMAWENAFLNLVSQQPLGPNMSITYSSERSIQDELARESSTDIPTVIISYSAMLAYIALSLGSFKCNWRQYWLHSKFVVAIGGIITVILSLMISVGLCSLFGVTATLIISEVIPFLVLSIGVDNIFILVETYSATNPQDSVEERMGETLSRVGSSITIASLSEAAAFLLGVLTRMPAVVAFSIYASVAILFDFLLQMSFFAAILALDGKRVKVRTLIAHLYFTLTRYSFARLARQGRRYDIFCCIRSTANPYEELDEDGEPTETTPITNGNDHSEHDGHGNGATNGNGNGFDINNADEISVEPRVNGIVAQIFNRFYAPVILHPIAKIIVALVFVAALLVSINLIMNVQLGLPQQVRLLGIVYY